MKALTVRQPWAWAIINGGKDVENRTRRTKHRGQLYIHTAKVWDDNGLLGIGIENMPDSYEAFPFGHVIGTVDVIDCHHASECTDWAETGSFCSQWAQPDAWHWSLADPRPLACPFPEKGKLGIWNLLPQAVA